MPQPNALLTSAYDVPRAREQRPAVTASLPSRPALPGFGAAAGGVAGEIGPGIEAPDVMLALMPSESACQALAPAVAHLTAKYGQSGLRLGPLSNGWPRRVLPPGSVITVGFGGAARAVHARRPARSSAEVRAGQRFGSPVAVRGASETGPVAD